MPAAEPLRLTLPVSGMTCASCVARVEKTIKKVNGTTDVAVNLATERASFTFDPAVTSIEAIADAVADAGYELTLPLEEASEPAQPGPDAAAVLQRNLQIAALCTVPVAVLNMGMMFPSFATLLPWSAYTNNVLLAFLTLPILVFPGRHFFTLFYKNLKHLAADMNSLVAIGTGSAFLYSSAAAFFPGYFPSHHGAPEVYFDTTAVIITLILLGKWLEGRAKKKTRAELKKLLEVQPKNAMVLRDGKELSTPIAALRKGDSVLVRPGERIPADGTVAEGSTSVDESPVTGESMPVEKEPGSVVYAGSINLAGAAVFTVTAAGSSSILGQIAKLVEEAQGSKAPIQNLADRIAAVFVPAVVAAAVITFAAWLISGAGFTHALMSFVAVLIIACPCALGLATPTALIVGIGNAAKHGLLIKNGEALERLRQVTHVVFDKTGTLTEGKPSVAGIYSPNYGESELLQFAASAEAHSEHPLGKAVCAAAAERNIPLLSIQSFSYSQGKGITARIQGTDVYAGTPAFLAAAGIAIPEGIALNESAKGNSIIYTAINGVYSGYILLRDPVKPEAKQLISELQANGITPVLLSGDNRYAVEEAAKQTGIRHWHAEVLPAGKAGVIKNLQTGGSIVAMAGDGINDAPALAQSDVSIAMSKGTDIAIETADLTLLSHKIAGLWDAIELSKRVIATIKQNLFWAFIYNVIGIPLAAFGKLDPMLAALAMSLSSVSVISNSLRLKKFRFRN